MVNPISANWMHCMLEWCRGYYLGRNVKEASLQSVEPSDTYCEIDNLYDHID